MSSFLTFDPALRQPGGSTNISVAALRHDVFMLVSSVSKAPAVTARNRALAKATYTSVRSHHLVRRRLAPDARYPERHPLVGKDRMHRPRPDAARHNMTSFEHSHNGLR